MGPLIPVLESLSLRSKGCKIMKNNFIMKTKHFITKT